MQKALAQMNIQLANVVEDITGVTGMTIIRAILSGERSPEKLVSIEIKDVSRAGRSLLSHCMVIIEKNTYLLYNKQ